MCSDISLRFHLVELSNYKFSFFNDCKSGEIVYSRGFPGPALVVGHPPSHRGPRVLPKPEAPVVESLPGHVFSGSLGGDTEYQVYGTKKLWGPGCVL